MSRKSSLCWSSLTRKKKGIPYGHGDRKYHATALLAGSSSTLYFPRCGCFAWTGGAAMSSCLGNMRKNYMLPFLDGELVVETYVSSCTTTSSGRLMMVAVSIIVYNGLPFLLGCSPTMEAYVWQCSAYLSQPLLPPLNYLGRFSILARVISANPSHSTHANG
jgi:hypothetical protein